MHNGDSRHSARSLRAQGWTLRRIANEVGAALSTVSVWVRDVPAPQTQPIQRFPAADPRKTVQGYRVCAQCQRELPLASFNRYADGHQWRCRDCYRAYFRSRAHLHRAQSAQAKRARRQQARALVDRYLQTHHCSDCGEADHLVLEFDHLQRKRGNIADLIRTGTSVRRLEQELDGCAVVCVNCHRLRTAGRQGSWRLDPREIERDPNRTTSERRNMARVRETLQGSACVDCGDARLVVLEFDHVGPKSANVIELARRGSSLERLEAEISQCEIRCASCHRRRTRRVTTDGPFE